ncbi:hypothetical protein F5972_30070 [Microbispora cellulosiformans]|uniref:Uncharacterized protein n=1 Tax=Microbispora cellulosiformans TaxID=2614688 RepID=A0A5J5JUV7_9ACTN|nr:hypothetical protein [Microbispora cellulosiformans]KAA9374850.1 hypothetical protein F5972_30070 [Microbispora cellulosiformans]
MTRAEDSEISTLSLNPSDLITLLAGAGWDKQGGRSNVYERWAIHEDDQQLAVLVPLDPGRDDYADLLEEALSSLERSRLSSAQKVVSRLRVPGDEVQWQKEPRTVPGFIPWTQGEALIASAKQILVAAAKATRHASAYHGQREWKFAREYLNKVLMGQTQIGSYIVTAYTPLGQIREIDKGGESVMSGATTTGRDVMERLTSSLVAAREGVDHFANTGSLSGFDAGVVRGVSCELTRALAALVEDSEGARVSVRWFPASGQSMPSDDTWQMEFVPDDLPALERASSRLASTEPRRTVVVVGTVTNLNRPRFGQHGTIILNVIYGVSVSRVRVRLSRPDYEHAISAHKNGDLLRITGALEKEGNNYWLYDPTELGPVEAGALNEILGSVEPDRLDQ